MHGVAFDAVRRRQQGRVGNPVLERRAEFEVLLDHLDDIKRAFGRNPDLPSLLFDDFFADALRGAQKGWRQTVALGVNLEIPLPAMGSALSFYDGYRSAVVPANLLQAQRDYFGAHSYRRTDREAGSSWHTHWTGDLREVAIDD